MARRRESEGRAVVEGGREGEGEISWLFESDKSML